MPLKLVPFDPQWPVAVGQSGAMLLDIHAIYRRPHVVAPQDAAAYVSTDEAGFPMWDLTGGLPVRDHAKWTARGFQYVTLAGREDLIAVGKEDLAEQGFRPLADWQSYQQHPVTRDPWHAAVYLADLRAERVDELAQLRQLIATIGPEMAGRMMQGKYPGYQLPEAFSESVLAEHESGDEAATPAKRGPGRPRKEAVPA